MEHASHSATAESAMTEIALALAMGFFAIMVLTMVSMGAGQPDQTPEKEGSVAAAKLLPNADSGAASPAATEVAADDRIVIFHDGRFLDTALAPVDPASLPPTGRVILAVSPDLPLADAIALRGRIDREDLVVSTLDARWMETLRTLSQTNPSKENAQ